MSFKTLKDFKSTKRTSVKGLRGHVTIDVDGVEFVCKNNLKQSAIEWIKKGRKLNEVYEKHGLSDKYFKLSDELEEEFKKVGIEFHCATRGSGNYCLSHKGLEVVLRAFLNITEEDLKKEVKK